jgi:hypothetical protein
VQKSAYRPEDPLVASTLVGTARPAFPEQLVEIKFVAAEARWYYATDGPFA